MARNVGGSEFMHLGPPEALRTYARTLNSARVASASAKESCFESQGGHGCRWPLLLKIPPQLVLGSGHPWPPARNPANLSAPHPHTHTQTKTKTFGYGLTFTANDCSAVCTNEWCSAPLNFPNANLRQSPSVQFATPELS